MKMIVLTAAILFGSCLSFGQVKEKPKQEVTPKRYSCVAGPNEQCASDIWYADYLKLKALQAKYSPPQDIADMMNGMIQRLNNQTPKGFRWDEPKQRWIKIETDVPQVEQKPAEQPKKDNK